MRPDRHLLLDIRDAITEVLETTPPAREGFDADKLVRSHILRHIQVPEGYIAFVEELPGANTQGATLDEACENLKEAVQLVLEANRELQPGVGRKVVGRPKRVQRTVLAVGDLKGRDLIPQWRLRWDSKKSA